MDTIRCEALRINHLLLTHLKVAPVAKQTHSMLSLSLGLYRNEGISARKKSHLNKHSDKNGIARNIDETTRQQSVEK